ncbi:MAG: hypothetical protein U1E15_05240 [Hyphomicrobiales bacterium]
MARPQAGVSHEAKRCSIFYAPSAFPVFVAGGYVLPGAAHVERRGVDRGPAGQNLCHCLDLQNAKNWQTWFSLDSRHAGEHRNGPGVGQKLSWSSNNPNVGMPAGDPWNDLNQKLVSGLDFGDMGKAKATVLLASKAPAPRSHGPSTRTSTPWRSAWFGLLFDRFIGPDFEKGLATFKAYAEKQGRGPSQNPSQNPSSRPVMHSG